MVPTCCTVLARGHARAATVVMTNSFGAVLGGGTDVEVLRTCGVFYAYAGGIGAAIRVCFAAHGAVAFGYVAAWTDVRVQPSAVRVRFAGMPYAEIVDCFSVQGATDGIPTGDAGQAGAGQADAELVLGNGTDEIWNAVVVDDIGAALVVVPTRGGAAAYFCPITGNDALGADLVLAGTVRVTATGFAESEFVFRKVRARVDQPGIGNFDGVTVVGGRGAVAVEQVLYSRAFLGG